MDNLSAHRVASGFESMLLKDLLTPLARGNDALSDYGIGALARTIAEHDERGFAAVLERALGARMP